MVIAYLPKGRYNDMWPGICSFSSPLSCRVELRLITGKENSFRETGFVLTLSLQMKENADKKILFESRH